MEAEAHFKDRIGEDTDPSDCALCHAVSCFAYVQGYCTALEKYVDGGCVFYRSAEEKRREIRRCFYRLISCERFDLLYKYADTMADLGLMDQETVDARNQRLMLDEYRRIHLDRLRTECWKDSLIVISPSDEEDDEQAETSADAETQESDTESEFDNDIDCAVFPVGITDAGIDDETADEINTRNHIIREEIKDKNFRPADIADGICFYPAVLTDGGTIFFALRGCKVLTLQDNSHEAIIPKDIFMRVQEELVRRRVVKVSANGKKRTYSSNHCFSQIVICGECGEMFRRIHWNNRGCKSIVWRCISRLEATGLECHARTVNEQELERVVVAALNELLGDREGYQRQLQQNIATVIRASATASADAIDENLLELQQELLKKANNKEAYDTIADEIFRLRELKQQTTVDTVSRDEQIKRITALQDFICSQPAELTEFDETLVRRWVQKITVWSDKYTVELKSGIRVDIET